MTTSILVILFTFVLSASASIKVQCNSMSLRDALYVFNYIIIDDDAILMYGDTFEDLNGDLHFSDAMFIFQEEAKKTCHTYLCRWCERRLVASENGKRDYLCNICEANSESTHHRVVSLGSDVSEYSRYKAPEKKQEESWNPYRSSYGPFGTNLANVTPITDVGGSILTSENSLNLTDCSDNDEI
jgi:hypothetical protein